MGRVDWLLYICVIIGEIRKVLCKSICRCLDSNQDGLLLASCNVGEKTRRGEHKYETLTIKVSVWVIRVSYRWHRGTTVCKCDCYCVTAVDSPR